MCTHLRSELFLTAELQERGGQIKTLLNKLEEYQQAHEEKSEQCGQYQQQLDSLQKDYEKQRAAINDLQDKNYEQDRQLRNLQVGCDCTPMTVIVDKHSPVCRHMRSDLLGANQLARCWHAVQQSYFAIVAVVITAIKFCFVLNLVNVKSGRTSNKQF